MPSIYTPLIGRFGNQMFQYAYGRARAEREGVELCTPPWVGEEIFEIPVANRCTDNEFGGYHQDQASLIYTRSQVKQWFLLKPKFCDRLHTFKIPRISAHYRRGDYERLGYVVVSEESYYKSLFKIADKEGVVEIISEESPTLVNGTPDFLPDFYKLWQSPMLFRANSSFSWWAGTLSNGRVFAPIIDGKEGGKVQDCEFVEGNWPKLANLPDCTDLHLPE